MTSFFPTPYPDEILYSILARYHVRSGNLSPKATLRDLFGSTTIVATVDLPSHINALVGNLPPLSKHTADSVIRRYTLYPFYAPFLFPQTAELVLKSMKEHSWGDIHTRAGIMASAVEVPSSLRFCPECLSRDEETFGESYWHRLHQVPGVLVCPKHSCLLQDSKVSTLGENRHEFSPASRENCLSTLHALNFSDRTFNELVALAQDVDWLINADLPSRSVQWYQQQYKSCLIDKDLATGTGRVRQSELIKHFSSYFSDELLNLLNSSVNREEEHNWLSSIVRKHRKAFHPVRHLLLMKFLCESVSTFFANEYEYKPFGNGPWTCFNGAANHYLKSAITKVEISWSTEMKRVVGTFSCSCGFTYSSSTHNQIVGNKVSFGKIKAFGRIWEKRLQELIEEQRLSLRAVARQLKVDTLTVKRHAKRLGLKWHWRSSKVETQQIAASSTTRKVAGDEYRKMWLKLPQGNAAASKSKLRQQAPGTYIWLYRNDRAWLNVHSPKRKSMPTINLRVDWDKRDQELLNLSKDAVYSIQRLVPLARLTLSKIGKTIAQMALLEKHLNKLPLTSSYLANVLESVEDFQIRRVRWAVSVLRKQDDYVKDWQVIRFAGLGKGYSESVAKIIADEIHQANTQKSGRKRVG